MEGFQTKYEKELPYQRGTCEGEIGMPQRIFFLFLIAAGAGLLQLALGEIFLFSFLQEAKGKLNASLALLPLLAGAGLLLGQKLGESIRVFFWILAFLLLAPSLSFASSFIAGLIALYYFEKKTRAQGFSTPFLFLFSFALMFSPWILTENGFRGPDFWPLVILRLVLAIRVLGWVVQRRIYERPGYDNLQAFLDFFLNPLYLMLPTALEFVTYSAHHENRREPTRGEVKDAFYLGLKGLVCMGIFCLTFRYIYASRIWSALNEQGDRLTLLLFFSGCFYLVLFTIHHMAMISFQVSVGRLLGYQLRYDMIHPLLSRSPVEYWQRNHNYVREFLIEIGMKPLALFFLRAGIPAPISYLVASVSTYSLMMYSHMGYRPFFISRDLAATTGYVVFLTLALAIPVSIGMLKGKQKSLQGTFGAFLGAGSLVPLRKWNFRDWLGSIFTFILLSISKAYLNWTRLYQGH